MRQFGLGLVLLFASSCSKDSTTSPELPPVVPSEVSAVALNWTDARLDWKDNSNDEEGFKIRYKIGSGNWTPAGVAARDCTAYIITALNPETTYKFQLAAYRGDLLSDYSDSVEVTTPNVGAVAGFRFVEIPAGSFNMGTATGKAYTLPVHNVTFAHSFWISATEVTQKQWKSVMAANPSYWQGDSLPVHSITWDDCKTFIAALNQAYPGIGFRLPSEAEWEYACRAGTDTNYPTGDDTVALGRVGWYKDNSGLVHHPVALREPNAWGLYDMNGNASEWVEDWWHDNYVGAPTDGSVWSEPPGPFPVHRGGASMGGAFGCCAQTRPPNPTGGQAAANGLRLVADNPKAY